jgi:hypothetical protein
MFFMTWKWHYPHITGLGGRFVELPLYEYVIPDFDLIWERDIHLLHPQVRRHDLVLQVLKQSFKIN